MSPSTQGTHAERADAALRRLRRALDPLADLIAEAAAIPGPCVNVSASSALWQALHNALQDAEPWPLELLGPVEVTDPHGSGKLLPAWFTRGWHDLYAFVMFARSKTRRLAGGKLGMRDVVLTAQLHQAWWAPPNPDEGRTIWQAVPHWNPAAVPVTVWVDPARGDS